MAIQRALKDCRRPARLPSLRQHPPANYNSAPDSTSNSEVRTTCQNKEPTSARGRLFINQYSFTLKEVNFQNRISFLTLDLTPGCTLSFVADGQLQIGVVAALANVSVDAVRYCEKRKLLQRAQRSSGNFRLFPPEAVERIHFIKQAQEMGLSLAEIRELFTTTGGASQCQRVRDLLKDKIDDLDKRMKKLREFKRTLSQHLAACETELQQHGATASCPVIVQMTHGKCRR